MTYLRLIDRRLGKFSQTKLVYKRVSAASHRETVPRPASRASLSPRECVRRPLAANVIASHPVACGIALRPQRTLPCARNIWISAAV